MALFLQMKMHLGANLSTFKTAVLGKIGRSKKCSMRKLTPGNTEFDDIRRNYSPSLQRFRQCVDDVVKEEELSLFNTFGVNGNVLLYKDLFPVSLFSSTV